jgi:hypothetical protein
MEAQCSEAVLAETEFRTYQSVVRRPLKDHYTLIIYDEIHHLPADMGVAAAEATCYARIGLSASPVREDGQEDLIVALAGYPIPAKDWPAGKKAETTIWVVDRAEDKLPLAEEILTQPTTGRTIIFVYRIEIGQTAAHHLGVPFIHGQSKNPLEIIQSADTFILSKVEDAGLTTNATRVIELDFHGGRQEAFQRVFRLQHPQNGSGPRGEFHTILTLDEYHKSSRRLSALYASSFDVQIAARHSRSTPRRRSEKSKSSRQKNQ